MNQQDHTHEPEPDRPGGHRTRSPRRWWAVGLAGVTGLALTTIGIAATPATDTIGRALSTDNHTDTPHQPHTDKDHDNRDDDQNKHDDNGKHKSNGKGKSKGKGKKEKKPPGTPVPCDADALIAAITLANARGGATLNLATDCTYLLTTNIDGAGLPAITTPITLNGDKHTTIERAAATDQFRILTINTGGNLTLNKLTITGGQTTGDGGGILVDPGGTLTTHHSTITRNITAGAGGGIANNGTTTVNHSTVSRNTAGTSGGGIWNTGLLTVTKSDITANLSGAAGGGVQSTNGTLLIDHSRITANQSQTGAGGLELFGGTGVVTNTKFTDNTANSVGGVLANLGQLTLQKVLIANNTAITGLAGGFSVNPNTTAIVEDSAIKNNTAAANGGGIFNFSSLVLRNTKVTGNQSGNQGGGIYNFSTGNLSLFNTQVVKNLAVTEAGGIFNDVIGGVNLNLATGTVVVKNRPDNCVNVPECVG